MSLVNVRNCIRFYQTAEELSAGTLLNYCAEIIASHWVSEPWRVRGSAGPGSQDTCAWDLVPWKVTSLAPRFLLLQN